MSVNNPVSLENYLLNFVLELRESWSCWLQSAMLMFIKQEITESY